MTASVEVPLGQSEGLRLEFKAAAALERPDRIGREVVAMLNGEGGEVWIGLREEASRAVQIEPIANAEREGKRLLDYLVDTLLPPVSASEVAVEVVAVPADPSASGASKGGLIRILVSPDPAKRRYALASAKGWLFVTRFHERLRPMTWQEVFGDGGRVQDASETAFDRVLDQRRVAQEDRHQRLWITIHPVDDLDLDLSGSFYGQLEELLEEPARTANRRSGWHFARTAQRPELRSGRITWGHLIPQLDVRQLAVITRSGRLTFEVSLRRLAHKASGELWPVPLFEYPASALRIAAEIYRGRIGGTRHVVADLALFSARSWKLRPGAPGPFWSADEAVMYEETDDILSDRPLIFRADEVLGKPDACAFRLVSRVYEAFGMRQQAILPGIYDPVAGRLVLEE
jgi:hypothetical protein